MPTIPIYRQQTDLSGPVSLGRVSPAAAAAPGEALAGLGGQVQRIAEEKRNEFDTLRAEEAFNQLREQQMSLMLDPEKGFAAQKSKNAARQGFTDEYLSAFKKAETEIGGTLQGAQQRALFQRRAASAGLEFKNALMRHVLTESNQYANEVYQGTLTVETNRAATEWNNPYSIQSSMDRIEAAIMRRTQQEGLAADAADALLRDARSKVHTSVLAASLEAGNVGYAEQYLKLNSSQMNATDLLRVQGAVKREADTRYALGIATAVVQGAQAQANPDDFQRLASLVEARESGGRPDAVSSAGARGLMQLMPATAREMERKLGMPAGETDRNPEANRRAGQAYLAMQLEAFGGDVQKALAAYNAGPGRVSNAIAQSQSEDFARRGRYNDWLSLLPKETQDYVAAIAPKYQGGDSAIARPTLEQVHQAVRERVGAENPERLKLAIDESTRQWNDANTARKQREDEATGEAFRVLETNGGRWDALPSSLKSRVPGDKFGTLREYAAKVAKGEPIETDWDVYYSLRTQPLTLQKANLLAFKGKLADAEFKELSRQQEDLLSGKATNPQTQLQTTHQRMSMRLTEMGVDPTPKPGSGDAKKVGQVWAMLDQRVRAAEAAAGRKLKPEELDAQIDGLFGTVEVKGRLWGTSTRRAFELAGTEQVVVPDAERKKIVDALERAKQPVTEERVLSLYKQARGLQ